MNGKEKNKIIPEVMLLKIDHCANIATPMTVVTDEIVMKISFVCTPQIKISIIIVIMVIRILMYLITKLVLLSII
ncbi:hypothetical protein D3C86_2159480 [compost metagenome]